MPTYSKIAAGFLATAGMGLAQHGVGDFPPVDPQDGLPPLSTITLGAGEMRPVVPEDATATLSPLSTITLGVGQIRPVIPDPKEPLPPLSTLTLTMGDDEDGLWKRGTQVPASSSSSKKVRWVTKVETATVTAKATPTTTDDILDIPVSGRNPLTDPTLEDYLASKHSGVPNWRDIFPPAATSQFTDPLPTSYWPLMDSQAAQLSSFLADLMPDDVFPSTAIATPMDTTATTTDAAASPTETTTDVADATALADEIVTETTILGKSKSKGANLAHLRNPMTRTVTESFASVNPLHTAMSNWEQYTATDVAWSSAILHVPVSAYSSFTRPMVYGGEVTTEAWWSGIPKDAKPIIRSGLSAHKNFVTSELGIEPPAPTVVLKKTKEFWSTMGPINATDAVRSISKIELFGTYTTTMSDSEAAAPTGRARAGAAVAGMAAVGFAMGMM